MVARAHRLQGGLFASTVHPRRLGCCHFASARVASPHWLCNRVNQAKVGVIRLSMSRVLCGVLRKGESECQMSLSARAHVGQVGPSLSFSPMQFALCLGRFRSNPSLNRTRNGMPPAGLISFWPSGAMPSRAG